MRASKAAVASSVVAQHAAPLTSRRAFKGTFQLPLSLSCLLGSFPSFVFLYQLITSPLPRTRLLPPLSFVTAVANMTLVYHAVKRGLEHSQTKNLLKRVAENGPQVDMSVWGGIVLALTMTVFVIFLFSVSLPSAFATRLKHLTDNRWNTH